MFTFIGVWVLAFIVVWAAVDLLGQLVKLCWLIFLWHVHAIIGIIAGALWFISLFGPKRPEPQEMNVDYNVGLKDEELTRITTITLLRGSYRWLD